ncbi:aldo-keto reductase AKR2E4-like isoform X2 [Aricia agestis]|uniref:aldo-keto reductase AKR2E4-like isoform X2 n=1 Tax=Aricia agestis TaxID=91739 RepID=UPI001C203E17|nr:aldo-keto reductase AKR2E4-like isoform X2 [Aricia agestis]
MTGQNKMAKTSGEAPKIKLNDGNEMPALALGTFLGMENGVIVSKENELVNVIVEAIDIGYRHIDTAFIYNTEAEVSKALSTAFDKGATKREDVFVTTKLWNTHHQCDEVEEALRSQLNTLGLTYVDLYLMHWPMGFHSNNTYSDVDYMETWKGLENAKMLGLTKSIGVSNFNKEQLARLLAEGYVKPAALQIEIHLLNVESELVSFAQSHGITVMAYSPFGSLVKRFGQMFPGPKCDDPALLPIANKYDKTVPQIALRWLVQRNIVPVFKTLNHSRLKSNMDIFDFNLTDEEMKILGSFDSDTKYTLPSFWQDHPHYPFKKIPKPLPSPFIN